MHRLIRIETRITYLPKIVIEMVNVRAFRHFLILVTLSRAWSGDVIFASVCH